MTFKTPCEKIVWNLLPAIRRELAISLIKQQKLSQREVAKKLGLSEAAVSRYINGKRGGLAIQKNKNVKNQINKSVKKIVKGDDEVVINETCQVCKLLQSNEILIDIK
jgi:predicted transcriptional regulator